MLFNQLLNIGNEAYAGEAAEATLSEYDEMMQEISTESEIDEAYFGAEQASFESACAVVENVLVQMAEKECGLEGANAVEVYNSFGLEAITDVVKRRAYSGYATIKSILAAIIAWFKRLLGLESNVQKIYKSLAKKAKAMQKELSKVAGKIATKGDDKEIEREILNYTEGSCGLNTITANLRAIDALLVGGTGTQAANSLVNYDLGSTNAAGAQVNRQRNYVRYAIAIADGVVTVSDTVVNTNVGNDSNLNNVNDLVRNYAEAVETWNENKTDMNNQNLYRTIAAGLSAIQDQRRMPKIQKSYERVMKHFERMHSELGRDEDISAERKGHMHGALSNVMATVTVLYSLVKAMTKQYVHIADECFTDAKAIIAKAM